MDTRFSPMLSQIVLIFKKLHILTAALEDAVGYIQWRVYLGTEVKAVFLDA